MLDAKKIHIQTSIRVLQGIVFGIAVIMLGALIKMQIIDYDKHTPKSDRNALRREYIEAARGLILDRKGRIMVSNTPIYSIIVVPADFKWESLSLLADLLEQDPDVLEGTIRDAARENRLRAVRIATDVDFATFSRVQENIWRLQGVSHQIESKRSYEHGVMGSHMFGYLREVTLDELNANRQTYRMGDVSGKSGIEQVYEKSLRGATGTSLIRVTAKGRSLGAYDNGTHDIIPIKGSDIVTTIDRDLQMLAEKLMQNKTGGLVAIDPRDGAILALVSAPQFDLNKLSGKLDRKYWAEINNDKSRPLFNRAISTRQPPGSTFKPVMGLIGLDLGIITPETRVFCSGGFFKGRLYKCTGSHGSVNLEEAILHSCNTYFFDMMDKIGTRKRFLDWKRHANDLGLGIQNGIDIPQETSGIIPDSAYFDRAFGARRWGIGDIISLGVGQGVISTSPLHVALSTAEIANGGYWVQPHIVKSIRNVDGSIEYTNPEKHKISWIKDDHLEIVRRGMLRMVQEGGGRHYAKLDSFLVAGKTGTAQNPHGEDHGWFVGFAPYDNPQIAIAVIYENGGYGMPSASPIAGLLMEQYLYGRVKRTHLIDHIVNYKPVPTKANR
jgi:penicillin-binding protein 2